MIDPPGDHPPPHTELAAQHPVIFTVPAGGVLYRHHQKIHDPVYFGKKGDYRFDDPDCRRTCLFNKARTGTLTLRWR